ncbi:MAG: MGMT family protein [Thermoguttaceae bacterium]
MPTRPIDRVLAFPSDLGWMAVVMADDKLRRLAFGYPSARSAINAAEAEGLDAFVDSADEKTPRRSGRDAIGTEDAALVERLQAFAAGEPDTLLDIVVEPRSVSVFQRRVLDQCRRIPYGRTMTYAALAAKAGFPGAARAVGNCMAANRTPLVVPCHRVVCSGGKAGRFSAPGGISTKRRLLALESKNWARIS